MVLGKLDVHVQQNETGSLPHTRDKHELRKDQRPKGRGKSIEILEENIGREKSS